MSCSKEGTDKSSNTSKKDSFDIKEQSLDTTEESLYPESLDPFREEMYSQSDHLSRRDILEYIRKNKLNEKYDYWLNLDLSRNVQYVELMKGSTVDQYIFKKYRSLKDTIPIISVQRTDIPFRDIISKNLINELNSAIDNIPSSE
jgi:hypothetical protein